MLPLACSNNSNNQNASDSYDGELEEMVISEAASEGRIMVSKTSSVDQKIIKNS